MTTDELFVDPRSVTDAHGPLNSAMLTLAFARYGITFHGNATIFEDKIGDTLLYWGVYQRLSIPLQSWLSWELMNPIPKAAPRNTLSAYITQGLTNLWLGRLEALTEPG